MQIVVETLVGASVERCWTAWTRPEDIRAWNAASDDWHTTAAEVDLRPGGHFSYRMEARDGSTGFDFAGDYTRIEPPRLIEAIFGGRHLRVEFAAEGARTRVRETFDAEDEHSVEMQRQGWQAILDRFRRHVEGRSA